MDFELFRIQIYEKQQGTLFRREYSRSEVLRDTIRSLPTVELRRGKVWQIGNIQELDEFAFYFRVGRISTSHVQIWDKGNFIDAELEAAPYSHAIVDTNLEVCAVQRNSTLAPTARGIASQFNKLLNRSTVALNQGIIFETSGISDPEDFIAQLRQAQVITRFSVTFSRPNAWDIADYAKPFQALLEEAKGHTGKTELKGKELNAEPLEELTRSAASTGNNASVTMRDRDGYRVTRQLVGGNRAALAVDSRGGLPNWRQVLERIRWLYNQRIRRRD